MKLWFGSIAAVVVVLLAIVFAVRGKSGTLHLEITDDLTEVTIGETGRVVKGVADEEVRLPLGEHVLHVERGELKFDTPAITVAKNEPIALKLERIGNRIRLMNGDKFVVAKELPRTKADSAKTVDVASPKFALKFDGQCHVEIPSLKWNGKDSVTMEFVVSVDDAAGAAAMVVASWSSPKSDAELLAYRFGKIWQFEAKHLTKRRLSNVQALRPDERVLLTCTWDGKLSLLVVNAVRGNVFESDADPILGKPGLSIGGSDGHGSKLFRGTIEQVRISKGVRTALPGVPAGKLPKDKSTIALYHFDEGRGSVLQDSSGNNHHGKIVGAKWVNADGSAIKPNASPAMGPPAFVLIRDKQRVGAFQTLAEAFEQLGQDNVIEIHGNGPFAVGLLDAWDKKSLTMKSAPGYRARITTTANKRNLVFNCSGTQFLTVEGIEFVSQVPSVWFAGTNMADQVWDFRNCWFVSANQSSSCITFGGAKLRLEDCLLIQRNVHDSLTLYGQVPQRLELVNCVAFLPEGRPIYQTPPGHAKFEINHSFRLERNTMYANLHLNLAKSDQKKSTLIEPEGNLFLQPPLLLTGGQIDSTELRWKGRENAYAAGVVTTKPVIPLASWIGDLKRDEQGSREVDAATPRWAALENADADQFAKSVLDLAKTLHATHKAGADVSKWPVSVEAAAQTSDPDRRAATYILSVGGSVRINEIPQDYTDVRELPKSRFRLTSITVSDSPKISDAGLAACRGCQHLTQLTMVAPVGDAGLEPFRECKKLKELVLYHTKVTDAGLAYFSGCRDLTTLTILEGRQVTDLGLSHFKDCTKLESLRLSRLQMTEKGIGHFRDCQNLRSLSIRNSPLDDAAFAHLKNFPKLTRLDFASDQMTNAGLASLPSLKDLTLLVLAGTQVDDAGVEHLKKLTKLTRLNLVLNKLTSAGLAELKKALPDCTIDTDIKP